MNIDILICIGSFILLALTVVMYVKILPSNSDSNTVKFVPSGGFAQSGAFTGDDLKNCIDSLTKAEQNPCQTDASNMQECSDYPLVYCDGKLKSTGDPNVGGCTGPVAYTSEQCHAPLASEICDGLPCGNMLCGVKTGHDCNNCVKKSGYAVRRDNIPPNPWGAEGVCVNA